MSETLYRILQVRASAHDHAEALTDLADGLFYALRRVGVRVARHGEPCDGDVGIYLGAHLAGGDAASSRGFPPGSIIFNTEQVIAEADPDGPYLALLRRYTVWDYSVRNVTRLRALGVADVHHLPLGYVPELARIPAITQDIDVLFYGSVNARRKHVLDELLRRGAKVVHLFGKYGIERDVAIARAKIVLNMHFYESSIFEIVRVSYLLNNAKPVVAECGPSTEIDAGVREAVCAVPYEGVVAACLTLIADADARRALAGKGHAIFREHRLQDALAAALGVAGKTLPADHRAPRILHIGSGKDFREDALNIDINSAWRPDAVVDISNPALIGTTIETRRFGALTLEEDYFDTLIANDVLEHIPDLVTAMTNALRLLQPGGLFHIIVPYDLGLGAWQDPTHVRAFNENSWLYYTDWHWYLGWTTARFDTVSLEYVPSAYGTELAKQGRATAEILRTPRAVDSMRLTLRKRYLQEVERDAAIAKQPALNGP